MNQGASQATLLNQIKKAMNRYPFVFNFSISSKEVTTNILDHKLSRLVASDQCYWVAIGMTNTLISISKMVTAVSK